MRRLFLSLLALLFLGAAAASSSPQFHHWLHGHEADHAEDACFIDQLASGTCRLDAAPPASLTEPLQLADGIPLPKTASLSPAPSAHRGTWENAPPGSIG